MAKRKPVLINKSSCNALAKGETIYDAEIKGFRAVCLPSGRITFGYQYTSPKGGRPYMKLGLMGEITPDEARTLATNARKAVRHGRDPVDDREAAAKEKEAKDAKEKNTVTHVLAVWLWKYARGSAKLRSAYATVKTFKRHVRPAIGKKAIYDVTRADITNMLDAISNKAGPVMADRTLAHLNSALNWWRVRDERFVTTPIVKGMAQTTIGQRKRDRALDKDEIRDVWRALDEIRADAPPFFPAFVRCLLLLGCRRDEVADMHTDEFKGDDWVIAASRYKTKRDHLLPLPATVKAMLPDREEGFVFSSDGGKTPFSGFSKAKVALNEKITKLRKREGRKAMPAWQFRDLRRTARTGIRGWIKEKPEVAKAVLGHVLTGMDGTYDVYDNYDEKRDALVRWAAHIAEIVAPAPSSPDNVVTFKASPAPRRRRAVSAG
jgi:integrase